ncbi:MAG TPA: hypothetical protein VFW79_07795 [Cellulomonas sp.]|uniref:hypothetical protein n=1 Tax=Cellulomonas sp. TaxID=40001 RepID=UPI002E352FB1|nr:hypothetical protein [Cellulomonas sp.]HEX5332528.1 hypothetical protein [Cellulomonas sp.]
MTGFDRSVAFWLRAYPRRWRSVRAAEVTAVLADLAGPDAQRLDARAAAGLVRGGWATRWREHPPLHTYLAYRFFNVAIPARYRDWARDDLAGPLYGARLALARSTFMLPMLALLRPAPPAFRGWLMGLLLGFLALATGVPPYQRRRLARRHLTPGAGEVITSGDLVDGLVPRYRRAAAPMLAAATVLLTVGAVGWTASALLRGARTGAFEAVVVAAVVGLALVPLVVRRLRRILPQAPAQPHRVAYGLTVGRWVSVAFWSVVIGVQAGLEITGRTDVSLAGVGGVVCWLGLPGVLAARVVVRRTPSAGIALADVADAVLRRRAPAVDQPDPGLVPADPSLVGTAVPHVDVLPALEPRFGGNAGRTT